jgi:uncharacterized protein HemY
LEIRKKKFGENHPDIATTYNTLGKAFREQEKFENAEKYLKMSLEI